MCSDFETMGMKVSIWLIRKTKRQNLPNDLYSMNNPSTIPSDVKATENSPYGEPLDTLEKNGIIPPSVLAFCVVFFDRSVFGSVANIEGIGSLFDDSKGGMSAFVWGIVGCFFLPPGGKDSENLVLGRQKDECDEYLRRKFGLSDI